MRRTGPLIPSIPSIPLLELLTVRVEVTGSLAVLISVHNAAARTAEATLARMVYVCSLLGRASSVPHKEAHRLFDTGEQFALVPLLDPDLAAVCFHD